ncbi:hypothetical protein [Evansella clarkii]|nr:hypothetical protein [Evansella clarkii]
MSVWENQPFGAGSFVNLGFGRFEGDTLVPGTKVPGRMRKYT